MTFNIIYTPNSVEHLLFFIHSLLDNTSFHYRLVSNGCTAKEQQWLIKICSEHQRLSYHCFPTKEMKPHGQVLNYLQALNQEEYFCFMDSDIFAMEQLVDFSKYLDQQDALFSAMPIWVRKQDEVFPKLFRQLVGTFNRSESGQCLGSTYFAVYKNQMLTALIQKTGVGFEDVAFRQLPATIQILFKQQQWEVEGFDTGKALNLILQLEKRKLANIELKELIHIGGISFELMKSDILNENIPKNNLTEIVKRVPVIHQLIKRLIQKWNAKSLKVNYKKSTSGEYDFNVKQRQYFRNPVRQYFTKLYFALRKQNNLPPLPAIQDNEILERLEKSTKAYQEVFKKYFNRSI